MPVFDMREGCEPVIEEVEGSTVITIDNFYADPGKVRDLFLAIDPQMHKPEEKPSFNGIYFEDLRHVFNSKLLQRTYEFLSSLCNQPALFTTKRVNTNFTRFAKSSFNDYGNKYWWPHIDAGYNAIVYLNEHETCGTNLYEDLVKDRVKSGMPEHYEPWRDRSEYRLVKYIEPRFNKVVMFDGLKFPHGMSITDDTYFENEYRMNQVFFFNHRPGHVN